MDQKSSVVARTMIETIDALPALTRGWIAPLQHVDPDLYAELAVSIVVDTPGSPVGREFPADVARVLKALDLSGKEIGSFRFAPVDGVDATAKIEAYDQSVRSQFDAPLELVFIGDYRGGNLFAAPEGIGLFDPEQENVTMLAPDLASFLVVQANAYDAYKRHIVKARDEAAYNTERDLVAGSPAFADTDVTAVFKAQLRG